MKRDEIIEVCIILSCFLMLFLFRHNLPQSVMIGRSIIYLCAILLLQSLLRDCWYLYHYARQPIDKSNLVSGICLESLLGGLGVIVGAVILMYFDMRVSIDPHWLPLSVLFVLSLGFLLKDFVVDFSPFKIYKDAQHMNVLVGRKAKNNG